MIFLRVRHAEFLCVRHAGARWRAGHPDDTNARSRKNAKGIASGRKQNEGKKTKPSWKKTRWKWVVCSYRLNAPSAAAGERKATAMGTKTVI